MRRRMSELVFYGLWVLTGLGFAGVYWIIGAQEAVADELAAKLEAAEAALLADDWPGASQLIADVLDRWRRVEKRWALHTQHEELDAVGEALLDAEALIVLRDVRAVAPLRLARDRLLTLPRRDRVSWENLL